MLSLFGACYKFFPLVVCFEAIFPSRKLEMFVFQAGAAHPATCQLQGAV